MLSKPDLAPETEGKPAPSRPAPRRTRRIVLGLAAAALALGLTSLYLARLSIARDVLTGWLADRGVESDLRFDSFGLGGLSGELRVGPAANPALSAERLEVGYGFGGFWSGEPFGLQVRSVHLVRPILHGALEGGKLTFGPLDPLIEEFRRRPPRPDVRQPAIRIEDGIFILQSDYGVMQVQADAELDNGKLLQLDARSSAAHLREGKTDFAALGPGGLTIRTRGDRVDALFQIYVAELRARDMAAKGVNVRLAAQTPYPDLRTRSGAGAVALRLILAGGSMSAGAQQFDDARIEARFDGRVTGWIDDLALKGAGELEAAAGEAAAVGAEVERARLTVETPQVDWTRKGGDRLAGRYKVALQAQSAQRAALRLRNPKAAFEGSGVLAPAGVDLAISGSISSRGGWTGLGGPLQSDDPQTVALKRALADFDLSASRLALEIDRGRARLDLVQPVMIRTRSGGAATLAAVGGAPVYDAGSGRFRLDVQGGGLPTAKLAVDRFSTSDGVTTAATRLDAQGSFGFLHQAAVATAGSARLSKAGLTYTAGDCATVSAQRLDFGENDVEAVSGKLCPAGPPLLVMQGGAVRLRSQAREVAAQAPFLQAKVTEARAAVDMTFAGPASKAEVKIASASIDDIAPGRRFNPVLASGTARQEGQVWRAELDIADPAGRHLADAAVRQNLASGQGGVSFDTGDLAFAEGGLQPAALSPLAAAVASPATGGARFSGEFGWTRTGLSSQGLLKVDKLSFRSPAGAVSGLSGDVAFTSLVPLTAAPGQTLVAERIDLMGPVTQARLTFGLDAGALKIEAAGADVGGGRVTLEPFTLPLAPDVPWSGTLAIDAVQVADIVEASPFGDRMALNAKLSGRLPFSVTSEGLRVSGGELHAVEPGTLSIQREALTGVEAQSGVAVEIPGVPTASPQGAGDNLVADFAYQALEHLAFDKLAAEVDSRAGGRLGVMFWVKGEFKPPQRQEIRLGYLEALRGDYMNKKLPLPSNTKVDLALDTSVNLDQLLADYAEYQRLRGSRPVQP